MRFNLENKNHQAIVNAMFCMIEEDGIKPSEVYKTINDIIRESHLSCINLYHSVKGDPKPEEIRGLLNDHAHN
ncbi:hypothetical protein L1N85_11280 [Paenibacillus alkaliterrae]|uniref:hypothetical protein n=1 Tax=Paenibacillus alkaliterrae TaxID=320909 RepID=UPI001F3D3E04|nr:hypothetical protein [Paenibacillus alkaliterrae]MCF2939019.1 hypothetical protein [Paenibacillus alkaliterrae]